MTFKIWTIGVILAMIGTVCAIDRDIWERGGDIQVDIDEMQGELDQLRKKEALERLKEILGIRGNIRDDDRVEMPPEFMIELYNTVTDSDGKTLKKNPYNAKVVRSFVERDSSTSQLYYFNVSGLDPNESVLEAELHLYRKRSSPKSIHPSVLSSPHYLIKVYQVLQDKSLEEPDFHRLLTVHYVGAYDSGWQVFNVKHAVLSWLSGAANLGFLVTATTIFGDEVSVDFSRRDAETHNKQPILVLFNDDENDEIRILEEEEDDLEVEDVEDEENLLENEMIAETERIRNKRHDDPKSGQLEEIPEYTDFDGPEYFRRVKKTRREKPRDDNDVPRGRNKHGFVPRRKSLERIVTSMDIYQRAMLREKLNENKEKIDRPVILEKITSWPLREKHSDVRSRRDVNTDCRKIDIEPCAKRDLYVNFKDIGLTSVIAPEGYAAYQCKGHCKSPLSQDQKPTNHATIQGIMQKMNSSLNQDVEMPCCVPVNLSSISILYHEEERDGVVLKSYTDMVVLSCGCR